MIRAAGIAALVLLLAAPAAAPASTAPALRIALTQEPGTLSPVIGNLAVETDFDQFLFSSLTR